MAGPAPHGQRRNGVHSPAAGVRTARQDIQWGEDPPRRLGGTHSSTKSAPLVRWWRLFVYDYSFLHHCSQVEPSLYAPESHHAASGVPRDPLPAAGCAPLLPGNAVMAATKDVQPDAPGRELKYQAYQNPAGDSNPRVRPRGYLVRRGRGEPYPARPIRRISLAPWLAEA